MLFRMFICLFVLLISPLTTLGQETIAPSSSPDMLEMIQNSKRITVNRVGRTQSFTMYSPEIVFFSGTAYLKGSNAATNPTGFYFAALDKIEMMTIPNPDHVETAKANAPEKELSVSFRLSLLERNARRAEKASDELKRDLARKRIQIGSLQRRLESMTKEDEGRTNLTTQITLLTDEIEHQIKKLDAAKNKADALRLEYLKKRRDAIVNDKVD